MTKGYSTFAHIHTTASPPRPIKLHGSSTAISTIYSLYRVDATNPVSQKQRGSRGMLKLEHVLG